MAQTRMAGSIGHNEQRSYRKVAVNRLRDTGQPLAEALRIEAVSSAHDYEKIRDARLPLP